MKEPAFAYCKVDFAICWRFGEILSLLLEIGVARRVRFV